MNIQGNVDEINAREERLIKVYVMKATGDKSDSPAETVAHTKSLPDDPFDAIQEEILKPPYDPQTLVKLAEFSVGLSAAVETMEVNIPGFGHDLTTTFLQEPTAREIKDMVQEEELRIDNNLSVFGRDVSLTKLRRRMRRDEEKTGNAYLEVIRNPQSGRWVAGRRIKSYRMRLLRQDTEFTEYTLRVPQSQANGIIDYLEIPHAKRFRRFVEAISSAPLAGVGGRSGEGDDEWSVNYRYYKEYADPRIVDGRTGRYVSLEEAEKDFEETGKPMPESRRASEIYHFGDSDRSPYGVPRWAAGIVSVMGARSGELVNLYTLQNNGVPSMVITVSRGRLTKGSINRIQEYVDNHVKGNANYSTFLILEGEGEFQGDESSPVKIQITPLGDVQIREMLFGDYISNSEGRILQAFRLPPIFLGEIGDYNKATADISRRLADEQVFAPERDQDDWFFNHVLFTEWRVQWHRFKTNTPNVTDNRDLISMATALERTGGMTPRIARRIGREVFPQIARLMSQFKEGEGAIDPDVPFSIQLAEAVKNLALANEPGQQIAPVLPGADPDAALKFLNKHLGELEFAAMDELHRMVALIAMDEA